ncbi:MAG: FAD-dependent oxidoreductase [Actinomycetota bacterium]|nr:FAD-dependent oxidoreductase [Actinomycetota bacterium]
MKTVIVGGVAGGMSAATRLRRLDPHAEIVVLERSGHVSYANCGLPYHLGGVIEDRATLLLQTPESLRARFGLDVRTRHEVVAIDPAAHTVTVVDLDAGEERTESYDHLVLSPGAAPFVPPVPGAARAHTLRNVEDLDHLVAAAGPDTRRAVVAGGGFIGLETAENLHRIGIDVTLVELADQVLAPLDAEMAALVHDELARNGIDLRLGAGVAEVHPDRVGLSDGTEVAADLVVFAIGVRPETSLARLAGLEVGPRGGIVVDDDLRTSAPGVYAVGDAVEKADPLDGGAALVPLANVANRQGRRVADVIAGRPGRARGAQSTAILSVFDLTVACTGWSERRATASGRAVAAIHTHPASHAGYYPGADAMALKLVVDRGTGAILGAQGVGRSGVDKRIDVIATAMAGGVDAAALADLELAYAPAYGSAKDPVNQLGYVAEGRLDGTAPAIGWDELGDTLTAGASLVDVRTAVEHDDGHIPGSINVPVDELRHRLDEIPPGPLVVYCAGGQRAHTAATYLAGIGRDVVNLDGGWATWRTSPACRHAADRPVATT